MQKTTLLAPLISLCLMHLSVTTVRALEPAPADPERRHTALLIGGVSTFASSYLVTAVAAVMVNAINKSDCEAGGVMDPCNDGSLMLVPFVGPFLTDRSLGVQLLLAGPQMLGALLAAAGVFHYTSRPEHLDERVRLDVDAMPLPTGGAVTATLTF